ncbi:MAG: zinc ABC transporter substrate-binding protein [Cyanobacteriota bacterium]|nr:zinc ABC transporter substrate-binding protein [Cyanobacteriota bacterium]
MTLLAYRPGVFRGAFALAVTLLGASLLVACQNLGQKTPQDRPLQVVSTVLPITEFTRAVAGNCATVKPLIPANVGPHDFQAKPNDLVLVSQADVLVKNGLGLETFLDKLIASADNPGLKVIDTSRGISTLPNPGEGGINPHIWLDPLLAEQQVNTIRDGLIAAKPSCKEQFTANAAAYTARLRNLNAELAAQLKPYAGKSFVVYHDFHPYFAQRYGLKGTFVVDVPDENPTPADLKRVVTTAQKSQLKALLAEPQEGGRSFSALAKDLGVKVGEFDSIETGPDTSQSSSYYFEVMRRNGQALVSAFGGSSPEAR